MHPGSSDRRQSDHCMQLRRWQSGKAAPTSRRRWSSYIGQRIFHRQTPTGGKVTSCNTLPPIMWGRVRISSHSCNNQICLDIEAEVRWLCRQKILVANVKRNKTCQNIKKVWLFKIDIADLCSTKHFLWGVLYHLVTCGCCILIHLVVWTYKFRDN